MFKHLKSFFRAVLPTRMYCWVRARRIRRFIKTYPGRVVEHEYAGFRLRVHLEDPLAEGWYDRDWGEPAEIDELRRGRLRPGATVLDIGAHQGVMGLILARIVGDAGKVVAVEAERHNAAVARRNVASNGVQNMIVLHAAAGARRGVLWFREGLNGRVAADGFPGAVTVEAVTVDDIAGSHGRPDVVFVDVEGFEAQVLAGASATIAAGATDFFVELHSAADLAAAGSTAEDVLGHFDRGCYDVTIALAGDTPPGNDSTQLASTWQSTSSKLHNRGQRCFVVARPRMA